MVTRLNGTEQGAEWWDEGSTPAGPTGGRWGAGFVALDDAEEEDEDYLVDDDDDELDDEDEDYDDEDDVEDDDDDLDDDDDDVEL